MKHFIDFVEGGKGGPLQGVVVTVVDPTSGAIIPIYSDSNGTPISGNAITTDPQGDFDFYIANGTYNVEYRYGGSLLKVLKNVDMFDGNVTAAAQLAQTQAQAALALAVAAQGAASVSATSAGVSAAAAQALANGYLFDTSAEGVSQGVLSLTIATAGTGGANGQFPLAFSGGGGTLAAGTFTVSGGAVTAVNLTSRGKSYTSNPTVSLAASAGLTSASVTAAKGNYAVPDGLYYLVRTGALIALWKNIGGTATDKVASWPSLADLITLTDNIEMTLGRESDLATTTTYGSNTGSNAQPGADTEYLTRPFPTKGKVAELRFTTGGAGSAEIIIHAALTGNDIVLTDYIPITVTSGANTHTFTPPLDLEKGGRIGYRALSAGTNLLNRVPPDDGSAFVLHGFGVGLPVISTTYAPQFSPSSPAMEYDFVAAQPNVETRLAALEAPRRKFVGPYRELVMVDEKFVTLPSWTFAGGSWAASTGLTGPAGSNGTYAVFAGGPSSVARRVFELRLHSPSAADIAGICTLPIAGTNYGGVQLLVDRVAGKFRLYSWTGAGDNGTLVTDIALPAGSGARDYVIRVHKDNFTQTLTCTDKATGVQVVIEADHSAYTPVGLALFHGSMGVAIRAGAPRFDRFRVVAPYAANPFVFIGDSIVDGSGILSPGDETYGNIAARNRNDVVTAGRSGDTSANFLLRQSIDLINFVPSWMIYALGRNDGSQSTWRTNVAASIAAARAVGSKIALVTQPPNATTQTLRSAMNADIRTGFFDCDRVIDLAAAVTVNQDGVTWAPGMQSGDDTHPTGYAHAGVILARLYNDLPELGA